MYGREIAADVVRLLPIAPPPTNLEPLADFLMSAGGATARAGGPPLLLATDQQTGEAVVTFADESNDPDGDPIVARLWTSDTPCLPGGEPPCVLADGAVTFTWGFRPGTYNVTLRVTDARGGVDTAGGTIIVTRFDSGPGVWRMNGRNASRQSLSNLNGPAAQPSAAWSYESGAAVVGGLVVSNEERVYGASSHLFALNPDGTLHGSAALPLPSQQQPNPMFLTSPVVDDDNGFVLVGRTAAAGSGWEIVRYNKDLTNPVVVAFGPHRGPAPLSNLILTSESLFVFASGPGAFPKAYAVGNVSWDSDACSPVTPVRGLGGGQSWRSAPTVGLTGEVYGVCNVILPGSVFAGALLRLDPRTGATTAEALYDRGASEMMVDSTGSIRVGAQLFDGVTFQGRYDEFDPALNLIRSARNDFTTGRSSLLPDGTSTVRLGYVFEPDVSLSARGVNTWDVGLPRPHFFTTDPSVDASGVVFVGSTAGVYAVRPGDGAEVWFFGVANQVTTQPAIANGRLYFATSDGKVYCLQVN